MKTLYIVLILASSLSFPRGRADMPHTSRTKALVEELLHKLDSTDMFTARKEKEIESIKAMLPAENDVAQYALYSRIAEEYANFRVDSSLVYFLKAIDAAQKSGIDSLRIQAELNRSMLLSNTGYNTDALQVLKAIPRSAVRGDLTVNYYNAWTSLYHSLYSGYNEPKDFQEKYRDCYNRYRDSLLTVADTTSLLYLRSMERKEARAGHFEKAREYNSLRMHAIKDPRSKAAATCYYDRFVIVYNNERKLTGQAVDDLLMSAIIEVEQCNRNIASLLRVEELLLSSNEVKAAKKVSDYYYPALREFGSRKRLVGSYWQTMRINSRNIQLLRNRNTELLTALSLILILLAVLVILLVSMNHSRLKIIKLKDQLQQSNSIAKNYIGVVFQFYSSYIKRLDSFRTKIHSYLKKGQIEQALELTVPSGDIAAEERRELYHNFDTAFVDIFPNFINTVNGCLKPEARITPKKTEILSTELRILALIKLGIEDSNKIAELLHCSVKTVYNLRSGLKSRLAVTEEEFKAVINAL